MHRRTALAVATLLLVTLGLGAQAAPAELETTEVYGMLDTVDPLVGSDWATPIDDPEVAEAAAAGATVSDQPCTFGDRPGVPELQIFRRPVRTTGHLVVTPSGNVSFVCHAALDARSLRPPLPQSAIVVDPVPCFLPSGRRTNDGHLVVTPGLQAQLTCHFHPLG